MTTLGPQGSSRRYAVVLVLITGIVASGCGSSSGSGDEAASTPGSASSPKAGGTTEEKASNDVCDLVSDDVAVQVLGVKIARREAQGDPGGPSYSCIKGSKRTSNPKDITYVNASVIAGGAAAADQAAGQKGSKPVSGLGDRAFFLADAGALFIVDGKDLVEVQVVKSGVPSGQKDATIVAKDVLSRRG
jgi:hypothetical protein